MIGGQVRDPNINKNPTPECIMNEDVFEKIHYGKGNSSEREDLIVHIGGCGYCGKKYYHQLKILYQSD